MFTYIKVPSNVSGDLGIHHVNLLILTKELPQGLYSGLFLRHHSRLLPGAALPLRVSRVVIRLKVPVLVVRISTGLN